MIHKALSIAQFAHFRQTRKNSSMPYLVHVMRVADSVSAFGNDVMTAGALCHDTLEDSNDIDLTTGDLRKLSIDVYNLVKELTFTGTDKEAYLQSFKDKSIEALIIKIFDRADNISDFLKFDKKYAHKYAGKAHALVEIFDARYEEIETKYGYDNMKAVEKAINFIKTT